MHLELEPNTDKNFIQSYEPGLIKVNNVDYTTPLLITPDSLEPWNIESIQALSEQQFQTIINQHNPEIIIVGTGITPTFLPASLILFVQQLKIGIESMTTAAACRTFNILLNEERRVVAMLFIA